MKLLINLRFSTFQILTNLSSPDETSRDPSELKAIDFTGAEWPFIIVQAAEALLDQILTVWSLEQDAMRVPRSLTATSVTGPLCPWNLLGLAFGLRPHAKISPSLELEMTCLRDGWKMAFVTLSLWPCSDFKRVGSLGT